MATKWFAAEPVGDGIGEQIEIANPQTPNSIRDIVLTTLCFVACLLAGVAAGWYIHAYSNPVSFSEAQSELIRRGYTRAAEYLGEMKDVCPNGKQRISCSLLFLERGEIAQKDSQPEVSNALPNSQF
jgi:hypothetical protein